jgi:transposase-like protein
MLVNSASLQLHCCDTLQLHYCDTPPLHCSVTTNTAKLFNVEKKVPQDAVLPQQYNCSGCRKTASERFKVAINKKSPDVAVRACISLKKN